LCAVNALVNGIEHTKKSHWGTAFTGLTSLASVEAIGNPFLEQVRGKVTVYPTFYVPHLYDLAAGNFKPEGEGYMTYPAGSGVEGTALFILTGAATGVSDAMTDDLTVDLYRNSAEPSHR